MTVSSAPVTYASITIRPRTRVAIPTRTILNRGEADFVAEDDIRRFLRLGLGACKMDSIRYD
jgi:hypothetical protein